MDFNNLLKLATIYANATLSPDAKELIEEFEKLDVKYVVIGGIALELLGIRSSSGDVDILVEPTLENSVKTYKAMAAFGLPLRMLGATPDMFAKGQNLRVGHVLEIMSGLDEIPLSFDEIYAGREVIDGISVASKDTIRKMKAKSTRPKDLRDVKTLSKMLVLE